MKNETHNCIKDQRSREGFFFEAILTPQGVGEAGTLPQKRSAKSLSRQSTSIDFRALGNREWILGAKANTGVSINGLERQKKDTAHVSVGK